MLSETHIIGERTRERIVLREACPALWNHRISMCGLCEAQAPYRMERPQVAFSEMVVGLAGEGEVWVDGQWQTLAPGEAYLSVAGQAQQFCASARGRWSFVWIHLRETDALTFIPVHAPQVGEG